MLVKKMATYEKQSILISSNKSGSSYFVLFLPSHPESVLSCVTTYGERVVYQLVIVSYVFTVLIFTWH